MKRIGLSAVFAALTFVCAPSAEATPLTGAISVTMNYLPNCGSNTVDCITLGTATGLDFIASIGTTPTPGIAGVETVTSATGDFAGLTTGLIKDLSFAGPGTANFPTPTILAWETFGSFTFDLLTLNILYQDSTALLLSGTGTFHLAGFENTAGSFTLSANQAGTTFSASASNVTVPDGGSTLVLLGMALVTIAVVRRRFA